MKTKKENLKNNFFIYPHNERLVLWNYENHEQYIIDNDTLCAINDLAGNKKNLSDEKYSELELAGILKNSNEATSWNWDVLSKIFHEGTKDIPITDNGNSDPSSWVSEYLDYCDEIGPAPQSNNQTIISIRKLVEPNCEALERSSLKKVLTDRKTSRVFYHHEIKEQDLSTILFSSFGLFHNSWSDEFTSSGLELTAVRKTSPSGGGLHPIEAYIVIFDVENIERGIYKYDPNEHALSKLSNKDLAEDLTNILWGQYYSKNISFGVFLTARFDLSAWKYKHSRAYRNVLLDAGHISQTFQLVTTSLGLSTWITGAFHDSAVEKILNVDGCNESVVFFLAAGKGTGEAFDKTMRDVILTRKNLGDQE